MNNKLIEELYNKIDAQNKMINELQLKLTKEKEKNSKAIEYIYKNSQYNDEYGLHYTEIESFDELLEILKGEDNE